MTFWYTGNPPTPWTAYKWGYTIVWNMQTKTATVTMKSNPTFVNPGTAEWNEIIKEINKNIEKEGYDPYPVEEGESGGSGAEKKSKKSKTNNGKRP